MTSQKNTVSGLDREISAPFTEKLREWPLPIGIVGLGISGQATRRLLLLGGIPANQIFSYDEKSKQADFQSLEAFLSKGPKTLVVSPGVPLSSPWIQKCAQSGVKITSELSVAFSFLQAEKVIAVTGSLGKSTTTTLIGEGLKSKDSHAFVGGNLGTPLATYASDCLDLKRPRAQWIVLELSSFQLENFNNLKADACVITHLSANHLERYSSLEDYYNTKWRLLGHTQGPVILNASSPDLVAWAKRHTPSGQKSDCQLVNAQNSQLGLEHLKQAKIPGAHNLDNLAMAAELLLSLGWEKQELQSLFKFGGLRHRLELLEIPNSPYFFINDSKATSMVSVESALNSVLGDARILKSDARLWCLLGGKDKNLPWAQLSSWKNHPSISFVFFGACRELAQEQSRLLGDSFYDLRSALMAMKHKLKKGDVLLLSPGGTSLDQFKNFEDRGECFAKWVEEIFCEKNH